VQFTKFHFNNVRSHSLIYQVTHNDKFSDFRQINVRSFSTLKNNGSSTDSSGLAVFSNADKDKLDILNYIKGKSGIYM
jgi:hypothetical protein